MASQTISGARIIFNVEGKKVAFANAVNYTLAHNHQPVDVLEQLEPAEYSEVGYTVTFTATMFRLPNNSTVAQGLRPTLQSILQQPELKAEIIDKITNATLAHVLRVKCTQEDFNVDARSLAQLTLSFVGIELKV